METLRSQFAELVFLPVLAALLPWSINYRLQRQLSRVPFIYGRETAQAEYSAQSKGFVGSSPVWRRQYRLTRMIDNSDPWVALCRGDHWLHRHIQVEGSWPTSGPFVATSMHWGTGLWAMRHIRHTCGPNSLVMRPEAEWGESVSRPMRVYFRLIERIIERSGGAQPIFTGPGFKRRIEKALEDGQIVMAMLDVPQSLSRERHAHQFLGDPAFFASGIIDIAVTQNIPVVPFSIGVDYPSGKRRLHIQQPILGKDTRETMSEIVSYYDRMVRGQPTAWHLWHCHKAFLASTAPSNERKEIEPLW